MKRRRNKNLHTTELELLVENAVCGNLTNDEGLTYVNSRYSGKGIAKSTYASMKSKIKKNESVDEFINHAARVGLIQNQMDQIKELKMIKDQILRLFWLEANKPETIPKMTKNKETDTWEPIYITKNKKKEMVMINNKDKDKRFILGAADSVNKLSQSLDDLYVETPVIAAIKQKVQADVKEAMGR